MVVYQFKGLMQNFLLGELCVVQSICNMDDKEMSDAIDNHFTYWQILDGCLTVFGVEDIEQRAGNTKSFLAGKQRWQFLFNSVGNIENLFPLGFALKIICKNGLNNSVPGLPFFD